MKGLENPVWLNMYIISNMIAILILIAAWRFTRLARILFFLLFLWAGFTNWETVLRSPEEYLDYADLSFFGVYREFIHGWFSRNIPLTVGFIATCQLMIAVSMLLKGRLLKLGGFGAVIFLVAIAPLGVGSAFPCTVILATAMFLVIRKPAPEYIWIKKKPG